MKSIAPPARTSMSCREARSALLSAPGERNERLCAHILECHDCRRFRGQLLAREREIETVAAVAVPEGIEDRVLLWFRSRA